MIGSSNNEWPGPSEADKCRIDAASHSTSVYHRSGTFTRNILRGSPRFGTLSFRELGKSFHAVAHFIARQAQLI
jgi:hypothetical protein